MSTLIDTHNVHTISTPDHRAYTVARVLYHRDLIEVGEMALRWVQGKPLVHLVTDLFDPAENIRFLRQVNPDCILSSGNVPRPRQVDANMLLGPKELHTSKVDDDQTVTGFLFSDDGYLLFFMPCNPWKTTAGKVTLVMGTPVYVTV
jgi:hypothetical protein